MNAWRAIPISWIFLLFGCVITLIGAWQTESQIKKETHSRYIESTRAGRVTIERRLLEYQAALTGLQSLYNTYGLVSREDAQKFLTQLQTADGPQTNRLPGLMLLEYLAEQGHSSNELLYIPPSQHFAKDMASQPAFNFDSRDLQLKTTNQTFGRVATVRGPGDDQRSGLGFRLPVYRAGWPVETAEQRRSAYSGTVGTWFDIHAIFNNVLTEATYKRLRLQVYIDLPAMAVGEVMQHRLLYDNQPKKLAVTDSNWIERSTLMFAGQKLTLVMSSVEENWLQSSTRWLGLGVLVIGLLFSILIFFLIRQRLAQQLSRHQLELAHFSRLSALGELSSAIAHEIRQPLAAVQAYLDGCLRKSADGRLQQAELEQILNKAVGQTHRAQEIIGRVQQAVRREKEDAHPPERIALVKLLHGVATLAQADSQKSAATLIFNECPHAHVSVVAMDIELALLNLIRNAMQAVQSVQGGQVQIQTRLDTAQVIIEVIDNGAGLSGSVLKTLFEAHQTSKQDGTGMGLRISRYLAENNGGSLTGGNTAQGGAIFALMLPLAI